GLVPDRRLLPVRDDDHVWSDHACLREGLQGEALELLARQVAALLQPVADGPHRTLGTRLRTANAGELRFVLDPSPLVEDVAVRLERDAVRAQEIGLLERECARSDRALEPDLLAGAEDDLALRLVPRDAARNELVDPQVLERDGDDAVDPLDP